MAQHDLSSLNDVDSYSTFEFYAPSVAPAANKSMISITNTSTTKVCKIRAIYLTNPQTTAVTGVMLNFELRRIASHSAGTALTALLYDTANTLDSAVTGRTGATVVTEGGIIRRWTYSSDEHGVGANDVESFDYSLLGVMPIFKQENNAAPLILRNGEGITLKQTVSSTVGVWDINVVFTVE